MATLAGYDYGSAQAAASPISEDEFEQLKVAVMWSTADEQALQRAGDVLEDQVDAILDVWLGFILKHPHLAIYYSTPEGELIEDYYQPVRARFGQWILDTCRRPYDRDWLNYQQEIALRHTRAKKNRIEDAPSVAHIPLRYMIASIYPITASIRSFLAAKDDDAETIEAMHQAWCKSVTLQLALWSRPYALDGDW